MWLDALEQALALAQVAYDIVDERCTAADLSAYAVVVLPPLERLQRGERAEGGYGAKSKITETGV